MDRIFVSHNKPDLIKNAFPYLSIFLNAITCSKTTETSIYLSEISWRKIKSPLDSLNIKEGDDK